MLHQDDGGRATDAAGAGGAASRMRSELRVQLRGLRAAAKTRALAAAGSFGEPSSGIAHTYWLGSVAV